MGEYLETGEERIGPYVIVNLICRGVAGDVYRALDTQLNRYVAIKRVPPQLMNETQLIEMMESAAQRLLRLDHLNIVRYLEAAREANDQPYFVMEYVEGPSLYELIKNKTALPASTYCELLLQACQGLSYAHTCGLVHGDIKPTHLLLSSSGPLKLAGFCMVQLLREWGVLPHNDPCNEHYHYLAPEQLSKARADVRSDIYSLGATFFQLLSGQKFTAYSPLLSHLKPELPERLCSVVQAMTEADPKMRVANYDVLLAELDVVRQICLTQEGVLNAADDPDPYGGSHPAAESYGEHGGAQQSYAESYDAQFPPVYNAQHSADPDAGAGEFSAPTPEAAHSASRDLSQYGYGDQTAAPRFIPDVPEVVPKKNPWVIALAACLVCLGLGLLLVKSLRAKPKPGEMPGAKLTFVAQVKKLFGNQLTPEELEAQRMEQTRDNIQIIFAAVQEHYASQKKWPATLQELVQAGKLVPADLLDGWGGEIDYNSRDQQIQSFGADELPDSSDDFILINGRFTQEPPKMEPDEFSEDAYK